MRTELNGFKRETSRSLTNFKLFNSFVHNCNYLERTVDLKEIGKYFVKEFCQDMSSCRSLMVKVKRKRILVWVGLLVLGWFTVTIALGNFQDYSNDFKMWVRFRLFFISLIKFFCSQRTHQKIDKIWIEYRSMFHTEPDPLQPRYHAILWEGGKVRLWESRWRLGDMQGT